MPLCYDLTRMTCFQRAGAQHSMFSPISPSCVRAARGGRRLTMIASSILFQFLVWPLYFTASLLSG